MSNKYRYFPKELSWLSFNERVLQEAADTDVPIIERVRFLGIYSNNMDEFFRVRVADVHRQIDMAYASGDSKQQASSEHLLHRISDKVGELNQRFNQISIDIILGLARRNIFLINEEQISDRESDWLQRYFKEKVLRHITPVFITPRVDLRRAIDDEEAYLVGALHSEQGTNYVLIEIPVHQTPRFIALPRAKGSRRKSVIVLDNAIRHCAKQIFAPVCDFDRAEFYSLKVTRDAEYDLERDIEHSMLERMSEGLKQRLTNQPVRMVYDRDMPLDMINMLQQKLVLDDIETMVPSGRYRNFRDFINFPNFGSKYLENPKWVGLRNKIFDRYSSPFDAISQGDILLYYPYHRFHYLTDFIRVAAYDPAVKHIRIAIYRVAKDSRILKSLMDAVKNGKKVQVIVELRARFDEQANIGWARELTEAGVDVEFGVPSLKCHAKLALIQRIEDDQLVSYGHIGTGNFNEKTAKVYTDFALFTKNTVITSEIAQVFDFIVSPFKRFTFKHLIVSPIHTRQRINQLINAEITAAEKGQKAEIFLKINNLVDKDICDNLYRASKAGVKIRLLIRGMCNLLPGVKGMSDNIMARSIVDRFLEHPRVFYFLAGGEKKLFISSADLMTRNIEYRVEVGSPILDDNLKKLIMETMEIQWRDTTKARIIDAEQKNNYVRRGNRRKLRSQQEIYDYLKLVESRS
ncbi:MAG TPA: polyphosphate kinase 1 [Pseudomonadales bacterium]|nr:polyphosphate kinase 1 [Pseudomonadales bacterium]